MQQAKAPHNPVQVHAETRQNKGAAQESPQGEHIAQLDAMVDASPALAAQRKLTGMIHNSPAMAAQRKAIDGIHGNAPAQREETEQEEPATAQRAEVSAKPNHTGLPDNLKTGIESLSGLSMDNVKVHYNSSQPAQLNALAYAQGTDIHVAPGQEQHLPHEAWHVVQQAQGRVKPTMQMKDGVPVNDDTGLEREADVMGVKAMAPAQLQSAAQAGIVGAYAQGALKDLYNARPGIGLPRGRTYARNLAAGANKSEVIANYIAEARNIGQQTNGANTFLDRGGAPNDPPGQGNWNVKRGAFWNQVGIWLNRAGVVFNPAVAGFDDANRNDALLMINGIRTNRDVLRETANVGLIDPFYTVVTIPHTGYAPWVLETCYSDTAYGYITSITVGSKAVSGTIMDAGQHAGIAGNLAPNDVSYRYSSGHDQGVDQNVGAQIDSIATGTTHGANHAGLDAVTKIGAEGARFVPVAQMGMNLKVDSKFYSAVQGRFLTFQALYARWGTWFNRDYGVNAATVAIQTQAHGQPIANAADMNADYSLDQGGRAADVRGAIKQSILDRIDLISSGATGTTLVNDPQMVNFRTLYPPETYPDFYDKWHLWKAALKYALLVGGSALSIFLIWKRFFRK